MDSLNKKIEFQFMFTMDAEHSEREAIEDYYLTHLELPPCNHAKPKSGSFVFQRRYAQGLGAEWDGLFLPLQPPQIVESIS